MPTSVTSAARAIAERQGLHIVRPVDAQQREAGRLVLGDALGIAKPVATITWQPSIASRSVTMSPAALTTTPVPYSTMRFGGAPAAACTVVGNGVNALDIATTTGSMMPSIA